MGQRGKKKIRQRKLETDRESFGERERKGNNGKERTEREGGRERGRDGGGVEFSRVHAPYIMKDESDYWRRMHIQTHI